MNEVLGAAVSIGLAIVGVAALAVIVSRNSNTAGVLGAVSQGFSGGLATALSPVTGGGGAGGPFGGGYGAPGYFGGGFGGAAPITY